MYQLFSVFLLQTSLTTRNELKIKNNVEKKITKNGINAQAVSYKSKKNEIIWSDTIAKQ